MRGRGATWASPAERLRSAARPAGHCREQQEQLVSQQSPEPGPHANETAGRTKPRPGGATPGPAGDGEGRGARGETGGTDGDTDRDTDRDTLSGTTRAVTP